MAGSTATTRSLAPATPQEAATAAGRRAFEGDTVSLLQSLDGHPQTVLEEGAPAAARQSLEDLGLPVTDDGRFTAASDPRSEGAAIDLEG